jgi:hypothetical protein
MRSTQHLENTVQQRASLGDEIIKYGKKIINDAIFEAQMGTLNMTSRICKETSQRPFPHPQTSSTLIAAGQGCHCFQTKSFSHPHNSSKKASISCITHCDIVACRSVAK